MSKQSSLNKKTRSSDTAKVTYSFQAAK
jgi:hypothetical protein